MRSVSTLAGLCFGAALAASTAAAFAHSSKAGDGPGREGAPHGDMKHGQMKHGDMKHGGRTGPVEETAIGRPGDPKKVDRTVEVRMLDTMRFVPESIQVEQGETVRFVVHNDGKVLHEMVLGTRADLDKHAEMMRKHPGMEHDEEHMTHVDPGKRGEIVWQFTKAGDFDFACLIPGHYEAGMKGQLKVAK